MASAGTPLNPQQTEAVAHRGGPLLIVAGAGTGKTRTLAARVAALLADGVPGERILLLTFTRRAARELLSRAASMAAELDPTVGESTRRVWGGTFHSVAARLLRAHGRAVGLDPGFTVLDDGDTTELLGLVRSQLAVAEEGTRFPKAATLASIWSRMVNEQQPLSAVLERRYPWCAHAEEGVRAVFAAYLDRKRAHQVLDYDDLLLYWRAVAAHPAAGAEVADLFDHVLVDEYQDTNALQADVLESLSTRAEICAVGDDAQAIYGFRAAATAANLADFTRRWPQAVVVRLEQSYRCTDQVLAVANAVMEDAEGVHAKELWSARPHGPRPVVACCTDEREQSSYVCEQVLELREQGLPLRDQVVLYRANHHADGLELELRRRDIPYVKYGGLRVLEKAHLKDAICLLRVLENPRDVLAWHRVLHLLPGIGPATTRRILAELGLAGNEEARPAEAAGAAPTDSDDAPDTALDRFLARNTDGPVVRVPAPASPAAEVLRSVWADCRAAGLPVGGQLERIEEFCATVFPHRYPDVGPRLEDVHQLSVLAADEGSRSRWLSDLTLDQPGVTGDLAGPPRLDDDWITLSTIHSAKGGEWQAVFVIHAADGSIPSDMALSDREGLEEERRLLYVALTRARDHLRVTYPLRFYRRRFAMDDDHLWSQPSRFLRQAEPYLDHVGVGLDADGSPLDPDAVAADADPVTPSVTELLSS